MRNSDRLAVASHGRPDCDLPARDPGMAACDGHGLRVGTPPDPNQLVVTMHRHPAPRHLDPLADAVAKHRVDQLREPDPAHGRIADAQRPRSPVGPAVPARRVNGVVVRSALNGVLSNTAHRHLRACSAIELPRRTIDGTGDAFNAGRTGGRGCGDILNTGATRCIRGTRQVDRHGVVVDVHTLRDRCRQVRAGPVVVRGVARPHHERHG